MFCFAQLAKFGVIISLAIKKIKLQFSETPEPPEVADTQNNIQATSTNAYIVGKVVVV